MGWYSLSREDYRERLVLKYNQYIMKDKSKELVLVSTPDCVKCRFIRKPLETWCEKNGYKFKEMQYGEWMDEITSVPCAMIWDDVILDYQGITELITSVDGKKSFY